MSFLDRIFKEKEKTFTLEDVLSAGHEKDYESLKTMWAKPNAYIGYELDEMNPAPSLKSVYVTILGDYAYIISALGRDDVLDGFKMLIDLGFKITDDGYFDDDYVKPLNHLVQMDNSTDIFEDVLDYCKDSLKDDFDIIEYVHSAGIKPHYIKEPFLIWLSKQEDMELTRTALYEYTGNDILLNQDVKDIFLF